MTYDRNVTLHPPRISDAEVITKYCSDPATGRYIPNLPYPYTKKDALWFIRKAARDERKKKQFVRAIVLTETNELVGMIGFHAIDLKSKRAETGYWIARPFWGKGLATEALMLWLDYGFKELKFQRICAKVFHPNESSSRVLLKCGFEYEGTLRRTLLHRRRWLDEHLYGILKEEYLQTERSA